ncbi:MAG: hypothetical protein QNK03_05620 [Myxococcota bacterium]|nr:hypothetical protein [Myxococcota bacterium]
MAMNRCSARWPTAQSSCARMATSFTGKPHVAGILGDPVDPAP